MDRRKHDEKPASIAFYLCREGDGFKLLRTEYESEDTNGLVVCDDYKPDSAWKPFVRVFLAHRLRVFQAHHPEVVRCPEEYCRPGEGRWTPDSGWQAIPGNMTRPKFWLRRTFGRFTKDNNPFKSIFGSTGQQRGCIEDSFLPPEQVSFSLNGAKLESWADHLWLFHSLAPRSPDVPCESSILLGRQALLSLWLVREITKAIATLPIDRVRVYLFSQETCSFHLGVVRGGVSSNHRRVSIPLYGDVLSQKVICGDEPLWLEHSDAGMVVCNGSYDESLFVHNDVALERAALRESLDVALRYRGHLVGKMTADNLYSGRPLKEKIALFGGSANSVAELVWNFRNGNFEAPGVSAGQERNVACYEAYKLVCLNDRLRSLLTEARSDSRLRARSETMFSRWRVYLTGNEHMKLFGHYESMLPVIPDPATTLFWGHVEVGGVSYYFGDDRIPREDEASAALTAGPLASKFIKQSLCVFYKRGQGRNILDGPVCRYGVDQFYHHLGLDRTYFDNDGGEVPIPEHLDVPMALGGSLLGKITIDNRWNRDCRGIPDLRPEECDCLLEIADKMALAVSGASLPLDEGRCITMLQLLYPLTGRFLS